MTPEWLRRLADWWHRDAGASYWWRDQQISRAEFDHLCRGVCPGDVDPAEQIIPLAESASYQRICEFLARSEAARFDPDSADWGKGA